MSKFLQEEQTISLANAGDEKPYREEAIFTASDASPGIPGKYSRSLRDDSLFDEVVGNALKYACERYTRGGKWIPTRLKESPLERGRLTGIVGTICQQFKEEDTKNFDSLNKVIRKNLAHEFSPVTMAVGRLYSGNTFSAYLKIAKDYENYVLVIWEIFFVSLAPTRYIKGKSQFLTREPLRNLARNVRS